MMFFFYQYICFGYTTDRERILKPRWNSTDKTNDANKMKWWVSFKQIGFSDSSSLAIPVGDAYGIVDVHFFFSTTFVRPISLEPLLAETPNSVCCLGLRSSFALLLTIQFASLLFFFSFISFFLPRFCPGHISGTVTRRNSKLSVLLGPVV